MRSGHVFRGGENRVRSRETPTWMITPSRGSDASVRWGRHAAQSRKGTVAAQLRASTHRAAGTPTHARTGVCPRCQPARARKRTMATRGIRSKSLSKSHRPPGYAGRVPDVAGRVADAFAARIREVEERALSPLAVHSHETAGRPRPEDECRVRTPFQRDRDRILHSKPFRRLKGKTQVFIDPSGDHYRTRMTHTLETTGIARVVARALRLNEDLTEAIGLGHDMGHPPFGHAGEAALDALLHDQGGFRHNEHSARIAEQLNLTREVIDGILTHTGDQEPQTLEGKI